jgi:hypothetical protein
MPFHSKVQSDKCYATGGFNGAVDCDEWAAETDYKTLPHRLHPSKVKKGKRKSFKEWLDQRESI